MSDDDLTTIVHQAGKISRLEAENERLRAALEELRDGDRFGIEAKLFAEHILNGDDR